MGDEATEIAASAATADIYCSPRRRQRVAELHEDQQRRIADNEHGQSTTDPGLDDMALTSNWMRRTGWATTFAGINRRVLLTLTDLPAANGCHLPLGRHSGTEMYSSADDERWLTVVGKAVDHFFDRYEDTVRHTDHSIRCWLRSQIPGHPYKAPFKMPGRSQTIIRYRTYWKRLMYFIFRLYRLDDIIRRDFLGAQFSPKQRKAVGEVWTALRSHSAGLQVDIPLVDIDTKNPSLSTPCNRATTRSGMTSGQSRSHSRGKVEPPRLIFPDLHLLPSDLESQSDAASLDGESGSEYQSHRFYKGSSTDDDESESGSSSTYSDGVNRSDESDHDHSASTLIQANRKEKNQGILYLR